jgi:hypothetical protein
MEWSDESAPRTPCPATGFRSRIVVLDALLAGLGICESSSSGEAINAQRLRGFEDVKAAAR